VLKKALHTITRILLAVSAAVLFLMMSLTAVDVVMRYVLKLPIPGAFEVAEYMMALIVPFAIAFCAEQKSHVAVDLFFNKLPKSVQNGLNYFTSILTLLFTAAITWQNFLYVGETWRDNLASPVLLIPAWPFIIPVAIGFGIYALIIVFRLLPSPSELSAR